MDGGQGIITSTARASQFPLPLLSTAEQLYMSAVSAGWGPEDDRVISRLYLSPQQPNLVYQQVGNPRPSPSLSVSTIQNLIIGVHLAATAEAMSFCDYLGIETDLMYDIVLNAAGSSKVFEKYFKQLKGNGWSLKGTEGVRDALVSSTSFNPSKKKKKKPPPYHQNTGKILTLLHSPLQQMQSTSSNTLYTYPQPLYKNSSGN